MLPSPIKKWLSEGETSPPWCSGMLVACNQGLVHPGGLAHLVYDPWTPPGVGTQGLQWEGSRLRKLTTQLLTWATCYGKRNLTQRIKLGLGWKILRIKLQSRDGDIHTTVLLLELQWNGNDDASMPLRIGTILTVILYLSHHWMLDIRGR